VRSHTLCLSLLGGAVRGVAMHPIADIVEELGHVRVVVLAQPLSQKRHVACISRDEKVTLLLLRRRRYDVRLLLMMENKRSSNLAIFHTKKMGIDNLNRE
jgi:hypothetical protein